jgi:hypothetical protein
MLDRRSFLSLSAASAGAVALGSVTAHAQDAVAPVAAPAPATAAQLRLTAQHHLLPGNSMAEKVEW